MQINAECHAHRNTCALKSVLTQLQQNADDDREALSLESWEATMIEGIEQGDEFWDYDGPLTWGRMA
ncbi:MAG: hypothetical protein LPK02_07050 [Rhodobacterales bacterium]|nr:hypothetical protein [Rhodobacterales bacterium]